MRMHIQAILAGVLFGLGMTTSILAQEKATEPVSPETAESSTAQAGAETAPAPENAATPEPVSTPAAAPAPTPETVPAPAPEAPTAPEPTPASAPLQPAQSPQPSTVLTVAPAPVASPASTPANQSTSTRRTTPRRHLLLLGGGGAFGIIYPEEINEYIQGWVDAQGAVVSEEEGFSEMVLSIVPNVSLAYAPIEYVHFELFTEFGWAPKILAVQGGDSEVFNFIRVSPGLNVLFHIPFRSYRRSFFVGGGAELDVMKFEDYSAKSLGFRGKLGFRIISRKVAIDLFGAMLFTKSESDEVRGQSMELNYTSFLMGATVYGILRGNE